MLITVGQLLPGPAGERIIDAGVLVQDGLISAVGPSAEVAAVTPSSVPRLDFPGATLLPGLVDGHVHLSFDASHDPVATLLNSDPAALASAMVERAGQLLQCGVTTVRDLGDLAAGAIRLRDAIVSGECPGPRILAAGAPLTPPGGHCWFFGGEVDSEDELRAMVRRNAAAGADVIKVMASGGHITAGGAEMWESQFGTEALRVIVDEAAALGLPVASHAHGIESITASIAAGVSTIEHCLWMDGEGRTQQRRDLARDMAERGIAACCTTCGRDWRTMVQNEGAQAARDFYGRIKWMDELGVPLITGTDSGIPAAAFDDFVGMLELYEWLGLSAERVIELATVDSAGALGLAGTTGKIAPGLSADLLVVDGDPRTELSALRAVQLVVARGEAHSVHTAGEKILGS